MKLNGNYCDKIKLLVTYNKEYAQPIIQHQVRTSNYEGISPANNQAGRMIG